MTYLFNKGKLKYYFKDASYNEEHIAKEAIKTILSKAAPTSSCWWSKLKQRVDGSKDNIGSVKLVHQESLAGRSKDFFLGVTAKTCPGILSLFNKAYLLKAPCDIVITVSSTGSYEWDVSNDKLVDIGEHPTHQFQSKGSTLFKNKLCFKITLKLQLSIEGSGYLLLDPFYHNELGLETALGYLPPVYSKGEDLNVFLFIEKPLKDTDTVTIPAGTTLQYLLPDVKTRLVHSKKSFIDTMLNIRYSSKRL